MVTAHFHVPSSDKLFPLHLSSGEDETISFSLSGLSFKDVLRADLTQFFLFLLPFPR